MGSDQDNPAAAHQLFNSLALCAGIIVSIAFHQVDHAPYAQSGADRDNQCLKDIHCTRKKAHIVI